MKRPNIFNALYCLSLLLVSLPTLAQQRPLLPPAAFRSHMITSSINKKKYIINVLLPNGYTVAYSTRYPVLYVLDGKYLTTAFYSISQTFSLGKENEIKDIIYVTIDADVRSESEWLTNRYTDLTPSSNPAADTAIAGFFKIPVSPSGGGASFLATIEKDIIPFIENKYKTSGERGIFGHSLGGLFAAYCLLTRPELFQKYSVNSPSLWWNNGELINLSDSAAKLNPEKKATVFISAGGQEGDFMIVPLNNFVQHLKNNYGSLTIISKIFEDETHLSVVPAASSRSLRVLYSSH